MTPFYHSSPPPRPSAPLVQHISSDKKRPSFEHRDSSPSPFLPPTSPPSPPRYAPLFLTLITPILAAEKKEGKKKEKKITRPKSVAQRASQRAFTQERIIPRARFSIFFEQIFSLSHPFPRENWKAAISSLGQTTRSITIGKLNDNDVSTSESWGRVSLIGNSIWKLGLVLCLLAERRWNRFRLVCAIECNGIHHLSLFLHSSEFLSFFSFLLWI